VQGGTNPATPFLANVLRQLDMSERRAEANGARLRCGTRLFDQKECLMEFKNHDFIRNPVVQNPVFFLESKCAFCGFSVRTRSIEELVELEKLHRAQCARSNAAA
jgi:hypothetical protein